TALTTSYCVDIRERPDDETLRRRVHIGMAVVFTVVLLLFGMVNSTSVIDAIYVMCGYTYGPLLGLFAFALLTRKNNTQHPTPNTRLVPYIAVASPIICLMIDNATRHFLGYQFGYELLMLNGLLTFVGLWMISQKNQSISSSAS
ncbi:MAG: sodium:solute symporter, partial [Prevotella sp.]|nr:sodium:solute symporter [Prevotella sp.]